MSRPATPRAPPSFAALAQSFVTEHLTQQRAMSPRTVATCGDAFVLLLDFAVRHLHKQSATMRLQAITPALILAFLGHLESDRGIAVRTRNARQAALRVFLKFAGHRDVDAESRILLRHVARTRRSSIAHFVVPAIPLQSV